MIGALIAATLLAAPQEPAPKAATDDARASALAEYNGRRGTTPSTADARWKLGLWCEQRGLAAEAKVEFAAVVRLDPGRESAWKKLGFEKHNGRWADPRQVAAEKAEADAQKKADAHWRPLLQKWKSWLSQKGKRAEAELAGLDDPRAVPAIWRLFVLGSDSDQERAIDILGHIEGEGAAGGLAGLAIFGRTDLIRRAASQTLARRPDGDAVLMAWIGQFQPPIKYEVKQVAGPGSPGTLLVEGQRYNARMVYTPPSARETQDLVLGPTAPRGSAGLAFSSFGGGPGIPLSAKPVGYSDQFGILYIHDYHWDDPHPKPQPSAAYQRYEAAEIQAEVDLGFIATETSKMAAGAQAQLRHDVEAIEAANGAIRERNARLAEALRVVSGQDHGQDREAWLRWWMERRGYKYIAPKDRPKATVDVQVPLPYAPSGGPPVITSGGGGGGGGGIRACLILDRTKAGVVRQLCFAAGTTVLTPDGPRPIESIRVGDRVLGWDEPARVARPVEVATAHRSEATDTLRLVAKGKALVTTAGHPFWKVGSGWTPAAHLRPGDELLTRGGSIRLDATEPGPGMAVFNLRVAEGSAYLVGPLGLVAHDVSPDPRLGPPAEGR